jgi:hypothetical protein
LSCIFIQQTYWYTHILRQQMQFYVKCISPSTQKYEIHAVQSNDFSHVRGKAFVNVIISEQNTYDRGIVYTL